MNVYDKAHELAREMKQSDEFAQYEAAKSAAMENDTNSALIKEYKRLQMKLQMQMAAGSGADAADMERYQKVTTLLQMSPEASAYLMAEFRIQKMLADIYKILGDAAGIDLDMLQGG